MEIKQVSSHFAHRDQERLQINISLPLGFLLLFIILQDSHLDVMGNLQFVRHHFFLRLQTGVDLLVTCDAANQESHDEDTQYKHAQRQ